MQQHVARLTQFIMIALIGFALVIATLYTPVSAQDSAGNGLRVTTRNELTVNPGETKDFTISVRNVTSGQVDAVVNFNDFVPDANETGQIKLILDDSVTTEYSLKSYLSGPDRIPLEPGEEQEIDFTVSIPSDITPGAYYGAVRFTAVPDGVEDTTGAVLSASLGSLILVQVPGNIVDLLSLEDISALSDGETGSIFQKAPSEVQIRLMNDGNAFSKPFGRVSVKNWGGDEVHSYELNSAEPRGNVLPDSVRAFRDALPEGTIGSFGRYTIEANISYGDGGNVITAKTTFWVLPWPTVAAIVIGLLGVILLLTRGIPAYNRHVLNKSKGQTVKHKR